MPQAKLLEHLANTQNCFISSLRDPSGKERVFRALYQVDSGRYTLGEWNYCISYLIGHKIQFLTMKDAQDFVKQTGWPKEDELTNGKPFS